MSAVAIAAVAVTAFNLVCSGTTTESFGSNKPNNETPFHRVYRIDLVALRWCVDECSTTSPIVSVTPQEIKLLAGTDDEMVLNRETGRIVHALGGAGDAIIDFGECQKAPFAPFPKAKF